jgi:hypothetical protein
MGATQKRLDSLVDVFMRAILRLYAK